MALSTTKEIDCCVLYMYVVCCTCTTGHLNVHSKVQCLEMYINTKIFYVYNMYMYNVRLSTCIYGNVCSPSLLSFLCLFIASVLCT